MNHRAINVLAVKKTNDGYKKVFDLRYKILNHSEVEYPNHAIPKGIAYDKKIICYKPKDLSATTHPSKTHNIICYDNQNNLLWTIHGKREPHLINESFTQIYFIDNSVYKQELSTSTYSGEKYVIDIETGYASIPKY